MTGDTYKLLQEFAIDYIENVRSGFDKRLSLITPEIYNENLHQSVGGLLSRQATLAIEMAKAPSTWNGHVAPLFLRSMVEVYITLSWILDDRAERSEKYVKYGLGQAKLYIEYLEQAIREDSEFFDVERTQEAIYASKEWLNRQWADWATEVNVGSWSGMSVREMAKEVDIESIYKYAYVPLSGAIHSTWQHVGGYNVKVCENPLHKFHLVPCIVDSQIEPDFIYRSAKYVSLSYQLFDRKLDIRCDVTLPDQFLIEHQFFRFDENT